MAADVMDWGEAPRKGLLAPNIFPSDGPDFGITDGCHFQKDKLIQ